MQATSTNGTVIAQGVGGAAGWMMHGSPDVEATSFVISSNHTVPVAFGSCKPAGRRYGGGRARLVRGRSLAPVTEHNDPPSAPGSGENSESPESLTRAS